MSFKKGFNTQPPEGGWTAVVMDFKGTPVSTHSRLKAAGRLAGFFDKDYDVSTHSRLKAAGL